MYMQERGRKRKMSYREKSIWGTLIGVVLVYGWYFTMPPAAGRLVFTVILLVGIEVIYHIALAIQSRPEAKDERDRSIEAKAYRNAYVALASGVIAPIFLPLPPAMAAQMVLLALVVSEVVKSVTQLYSYRSGI